MANNENIISPRCITAYPDGSFDDFVPKPSYKYPCTTRRIDALLQVLNKKKFGENAIRLESPKLREQRSQLKELARTVLVIMREDGISLLSNWGTDVQDVDKRYYSLILEQKAKRSGIDISLCKDRWCAMTLLHEGFKGKKQAFKKREKRKSEVCNLIDNLHNRIKSNFF